MEIKKIAVSLLGAGALLVSGCSTTTASKNIQAIGTSGDRDAVVYNEVEITQRKDILALLTGAVPTREVKDQRVAFCDKQSGTYDCKSLPIQIDGEPMTVKSEQGFLAQ